MTILTMIQNACEDIGIASPSTVVGNTDRQIVQLLQLAQREGRDLGSRCRWTAMVKSTTFTQSAAASQGAITTVAGADFDYILPDSMWNRTTTLPVVGPLSAEEWQTLQAFPVTGPYQQFRIQNAILYFDPVPPNATDTIAFEYKFKNFCESSGGTDQSAWAADTDVGLLDENIMELGIIWRWKKRKGLSYAEDFNIYERRVANAIARDGGKRTLYLHGSRGNRVPGVMVPLGSWTP